VRNDDATKMNSRVTYRNYGRIFLKEEDNTGNIILKKEHKINVWSTVY